MSLFRTQYRLLIRKHGFISSQTIAGFVKLRSKPQQMKLEKCWRELANADESLDVVARMVNLLKEGALSFSAGECNAALRAFKEAMALCEKAKAREFYAEAAWELHRTQLACGELLIAPGAEVERTCADSIPLLSNAGLVADAEQAALPTLRRYGPMIPPEWHSNRPGSASRSLSLSLRWHFARKGAGCAAAQFGRGRRGMRSSARPRQSARQRRSRGGTALS
jgi:hypothetical protein